MSRAVAQRVAPALEAHFRYLAELFGQVAGAFRRIQKRQAAHNHERRGIAWTITRGARLSESLARNSPQVLQEIMAAAMACGASNSLEVKA